MADLYVYQPNHGYPDDTLLFASWLNANFFVSGTGETGGGDSYRLALESGGTDFVQFSETITEGFVRIVTGAATTSITGLDHLDGETVSVFSNGELVTTALVASGTITVPQVFNYVVGIPFTLSIKTTRLEVPAASTNQTRIKRINETVIRHIRTNGGQAGQEYDGKSYMTNLEATFSNLSNDSTITTEGGFSEDSYTVIQSSDPNPMTALAAIIGYSVEEVR